MKCLLQEIQFASHAPAFQLLEMKRRLSYSISGRMDKQAMAQPALLTQISLGYGKGERVAVLIGLMGGNESP